MWWREQLIMKPSLTVPPFTDPAWSPNGLMSMLTMSAKKHGSLTNQILVPALMGDFWSWTRWIVLQVVICIIINYNQLSQSVSRNAHVIKQWKWHPPIVDSCSASWLCDNDTEWSNNLLTAEWREGEGQRWCQRDARLHCTKNEFVWHPKLVLFSKFYLDLLSCYLSDCIGPLPRWLPTWATPRAGPEQVRTDSEGKIYSDQQGPQLLVK